MRTGQAKDASKVEHLSTETKRLQSIVNDMRNQISDLEGRNSLLERQYADLLRQHEEVRDEPTETCLSALIICKHVLFMTLTHVYVRTGGGGVDL